MLRWSKRMAFIVVTVSISRVMSANEYLYQDDDLLCGPGFSPESYYQRIRQHEHQQRVSYFENQRAIANQAAAEQRSLEMAQSARRARNEKEARKRAELIAKRKAENSANNAAQTVSTQPAVKPLKPSR